MTDTYHLSDWVKRYLVIRKPELNRSTLISYRKTCRLLIEFFEGDPELCDITKPDATDFKNHLITCLEYEESTAAKIIKESKVIFDRAVDEDRIQSSPFGRVKCKAPIKSMHDRFMVPEKDVLQVMESSPTFKMFTALIFWGGLRRSEALYLKWDHVHLSSNKLIVEPRAGKVTTKQRVREVRIEPELAALLLRGPQGTETVAGLGKKASSINKLLNNACDNAGVQRFTPQQLRQTRATVWNTQYPRWIAAYWMGHSEATAKNHYLSVPEDYYSNQHAA